MDKGFIRHASFHEAHVEAFEVVTEPGAEAVEDRYGRLPVIVFNDMAPDEAGASGHEDIHGLLHCAQQVRENPQEMQRRARPQVKQKDRI